MSWRERLRPASFRGIRFYVESADLSAERRVQTHEFPYQDAPAHEDLGARPDEISLEAYVLGDDYLDILDNLEAALRRVGPGELVHPTSGSIRVVVKRFTLRHDTRDANLARIQIEAQKTRPTEIRERRTTSRGERQASMQLASQEVEAIAAQEFEVRLQTGGPEFTRTPVAATVGALGTELTQLGLAGGASVTPTYLAEVQAMADGVLDSIENPTGLATEVQGLIERISGAYESRLAAFEAYGVLGTVKAPVVRGGSSQAAVGRENAQATETLIQSTALARQALELGDIPWLSREAALEARDRVILAIDRASLVASDQVYLELRKLAATVTNAVPGPEGEIPSLEPVQLGESVPALVLSQRLYGTSAREQEIVDRNSVRHPGFVPAGRVLEVVARGS